METYDMKKKLYHFKLPLLKNSGMMNKKDKENEVPYEVAKADEPYQKSN